MLRPTLGSALGPKTRAETPTITTISGTPSPNMQLQENPRFWALVGRSRASARPPRFLTLELKNSEVEEEREVSFVDGIELRGTAMVEDDAAAIAIGGESLIWLVFCVFWGKGYQDFMSELTVKQELPILGFFIFLNYEFKSLQIPMEYRLQNLSIRVGSSFVRSSASPLIFYTRLSKCWNCPGMSIGPSRLGSDQSVLIVGRFGCGSFG